MNDDKEDDSPWDDDDGARTLATASPSFESNIPSPITVPPPPVRVPAAPPRPAPAAGAPAAPAPPAVPAAPAPPTKSGVAGAVRPGSAGAIGTGGTGGAKMAPKPTLVGLNPADFMKSLPRVGSAPKVPVAAPRLPAQTDVDLDDDPPQDEDDGPTMLGGAQPPAISSSSLQGGPGHLDKRASRPDLAPARSSDDGDALPDLSSAEDGDETTRAVPREELARTPEPPPSARAVPPGRSASVIVGQGAVGDEATLAIGPGTLDPSFAAGAASLGPPLPPQPASLGQPGSQPRIPAPFPGAPPPYAGPIPDPLLPSGPPSFGGPPPSWQGPAQGHPGAPPQPGPPASAPWQTPTQPPPALPQPQGSMGPGFGQPSLQQPGTAPAPWLVQQPPHAPHNGMHPSAGGAGGPGFAPQPGHAPGYPPGPNGMVPPSPARFQITPQIMLLAGVGIVCFAIFITGVVLFITSKG